MNDALYISATGMQAQQLNVDTIANNLANVNTTGFKKNRVSFQDVFYRSANPAAVGNDPEAALVTLGLGTLVSSNSKSFLPGDLKQTDVSLDLAIRGSGFFEVEMPDGSSTYTRFGGLRVTSDGLLGTAAGYPLKQRIQIPTEATEIVIDSSGKVSAKMPDETSLVELGQIELVNFANPQGLDALGDNLYGATTAAGSPVTVKPGESGMGTIAQGYLESSNVKLAEEMVNLVLAQRAYELNAKVIQAADEMLSISNNLRR
jgi:flagellar basal-body rod protein FlgG